MGKDMDIGNYSHDADFEAEVFKNVFWVPINTFGRTRYTRADMTELAKFPPVEKRSRIGNLYEAVQLFQISSFKGVLIIRIFG